MTASGTADPAARAVIVHSFVHAICAAEAARSTGSGLTLISPPNAAATVGAGWFAGLVGLVRDRFPELALTPIMDCGDRPGAVLDAARRGFPILKFSGPLEILEKLQQIAAHHGAVIAGNKIPALDLLRCRDPKTACDQWFAAAFTVAPEASVG